MALNRNHPTYRKLDQLVLNGKAQMIATPTISTASTPTVVATQAGEVAIITKIVCTGYPNKETSPGFNDDDEETNGLFLYDENSDLTLEGLSFLRFRRNDLLFEGAQTPSWRSAVPCKPIVWEPEQPLVIPPKHTLRSSMNSNMAGGCFACYGYVVDQDTARSLGFSTNTQDLSYSNKLNRQGFRGAIIASVDVSKAYWELIPAITGYAIQIIDVHVRMQPIAHAPTNIIYAYYGAAGNFLDQNYIMQFVNNNPGDMAEWSFSPGIYLPADKSFFFGRFNPSLSDSAASGSVNVTYRYVPSSEVPQDQWWSYIQPSLPTPSTGSIGTNDLFTAISTDVVPFYPGKSSQPSTSNPGNGKQHIVEGFCFSAQKDTTVASSQLYWALTTGTSTTGTIGVASSGLTTTNYLISPIIALSSHDQMLAMAVDGLAVPCVPDSGLVLIDTTATGPVNTPVTNLQVDEWNCLVWGRTIDTKVKSASGHFKGAAS